MQIKSVLGSVGGFFYCFFIGLGFGFFKLFWTQKVGLGIKEFNLDVEGCMHKITC